MNCTRSRTRSTDAHGKPALWVGLAGVTMQSGAFAFDSAKVMG